MNVTDVLLYYCAILFIVFGFAVHLKIEEIGRMLRTGDLGIPTNPTERYANSYSLAVFCITHARESHFFC